MLTTSIYIAAHIMDERDILLTLHCQDVYPPWLEYLIGYFLLNSQNPCNLSLPSSCPSLIDSLSHWLFYGDFPVSFVLLQLSRVPKILYIQLLSIFQDLSLYIDTLLSLYCIGLCYTVTSMGTAIFRPLLPCFGHRLPICGGFPIVGNEASVSIASSLHSPFSSLP